MTPVYVTKPSLPPLEEYVELLQDIWERRWLTNQGHYHEEFEAALSEHLGVGNVSLFCNGTIALQVGLQALRITGEVITTPYSFPATTHALYWNHCTPVFCDVDPVTGNMDPAKVEGKSGRDVEAFRLTGYWKPFHFRSTFVYVETGGYESEPNFQRWLSAYREELREAGENVDIW